MTYKLKKYIQIMRPHHWIKNLLVFMPMITSNNLNLNYLVDASLAFFVFSLTASSIYILNDFFDLESDKKHPSKKYRPLPSNLVSLPVVLILSISLLLISLLISFYLNVFFLIIITSYFVLNIAYSLLFKKIKFIDIFILSLFYTIRIIAGGAATKIDLSIWLILFSLTVFTSLSSIKRLGEIINLKKLNFTKIFGRDYVIEDLLKIKFLTYFSTISAIIVLILYINSPNILNLYKSVYYLYPITVILFLWLLRLIFQTEKGNISADPIVFTITDKISYLSLAAILMLIYIGYK